MRESNCKGGGCFLNEEQRRVIIKSGEVKGVGSEDSKINKESLKNMESKKLDSQNHKPCNHPFNKNKRMPPKILCLSVFAFVFVIIASNYLVGFRILETHVTYGALSYPISFLIMDILSEKFSKKETMKALRLGLLLAFFPSLYICDNYLIAIASVCAFFTSQFLDVIFFYELKQKYPSLWWLRSGVNSSLCQFVDTFIFFHIAFFIVFPYSDVVIMLLLDFIIKLIVSIIDIPIFYLLAIKSYKETNLLKS